jgi:hypothetical protein
MHTAESLDKGLKWSQTHDDLLLDISNPATILNASKSKLTKKY